MKNIIGKICVIFVLLVLIIGISGVYSGYKEVKMLDQECQDLNYSEYTFKMGFTFCEDAEKNLHYIDFECDYKIGFIGLFPESCDLYKITVGEVEVKQ